MGNDAVDARGAVIELIATFAREGREVALQRLGREITVTEVGIMMRVLPPATREILLRNSAPDLHDTLVALADDTCAEVIDLTGPGFASPYGPPGDTPGKALQKYLAIHCALKAAGELPRSAKS